MIEIQFQSVYAVCVCTVSGASVHTFHTHRIQYLIVDGLDLLDFHKLSLLNNEFVALKWLAEIILSIFYEYIVTEQSITALIDMTERFHDDIVFTFKKHNSSASVPISLHFISPIRKRCHLFKL